MKLRVFTLNCWGIGYAPFMRSPDRKERMEAIAQHLAAGENKYDFAFLQELWVERDRKAIREACKHRLPHCHEFMGFV